MRTEIIQLGERIAESAVHLDAAMHRLLADIRAFDDAKGWGEQGFQSCAHWLSWRVGWTPTTARERVRVAHSLAALPKIDDELRRGAISYSKVRAITRVANEANEQVLIDYAHAAPAAQLETICRKYRAVQEAATQDPDAEAAQRRITRRRLDGGMVRIEVVLRADEAAVVWAAVERAASDASAEACNRSRNRNPVDGLVALAQDYARGDRPDRTPVELLVTVPLATLTGASDEPAAIADGSYASAETARRLACDAGIVLVGEGPAGETLSVGHKTRSLPSSIKRALLHRDKTCRFPGCTNRRFVEGHHIRHWADGGETALTNLVTLCTFHHAFVHERGFRIEMSADGQPTFHHPRRGRLDAVPPRPTPALLGHPAIEAANAELDLDADTGRCTWDGTSIDHSAAVRGLLSTDRRRRSARDADEELAADRDASERHARTLASREREELEQNDYALEILARCAARNEAAG